MKEKAIGGYFELENRVESEYYPNLIRLNSGRNCIEYILRARKYKKIYIPHYTCAAVKEPILKLGIAFEYYSINNKLEAKEIKSVNQDEVFLVINYFGLKGEYIKSLSKTVPNLMVDNSQAFFEKPILNVDTFYSARKFFGVPDGAYLSTNCMIREDLPREISWNRSEFLLRRLENGAQDAYEKFQENEQYLCGQEIKSMSNLTIRLLAGINYDEVQTRRNQNFQYLHLKLAAFNRLRIAEKEIHGPMVYPFLADNEKVRNELIKQKIYVAGYWPNVLKENKKNSIEYNFASNLIALPVDQRYGLLDMDRICGVLKSLIQI